MQSHGVHHAEQVLELSTQQGGCCAKLKSSAAAPLLCMDGIAADGDSPFMESRRMSSRMNAVMLMCVYGIMDAKA